MSVTVVLCVSVPKLPDTTTLKVPNGVLPVVVMVSCAVEADDPFSVTEAGDTEQVVFAGTPLQPKATV